ncbi:hypothetical protein ACJX0J_003629, partial [Zea mays]
YYLIAWTILEALLFFTCFILIALLSGFYWSNIRCLLAHLVSRLKQGNTIMWLEKHAVKAEKAHELGGRRR